MQYQMLFTSLFVMLTSCQKASQPSSDNPGGSGGPGGPPQAALTVNVTTIGANFSHPYKLCYDSRNKSLYVADQNQVKVIDEHNNVTTLIGQGVLSNWDEILDIDVAPGASGSLYFTTKYNTLYKLDGSNNELTVLTSGEGNGNGPLNTNDHLQGAYGVAPGSNGDVALYNTYWTALKRVNASGDVQTWAGKPTVRALDGSWPFSDGQGTNATFSSHVYDICSDGKGNIYLPDRDNALIRMITSTGMVSSIPPYVDADGDYLIAKIKADGVAAVTANQDGSYIYFTCPIGSFGNSASLIRLYRPGKGVVSIAGFHDGTNNGSGKDAGFGSITGLATSPDGKTLFVSEEYNKTVRKITIE
ncbi:MAG: hypothetical protein JST68_07875 [Bacteroidetes bacterium]|nr:hypothetical protein [Bacteroidota bacterium]